MTGILFSLSLVLLGNGPVNIQEPITELSSHVLYLEDIDGSLMLEAVQSKLGEFQKAPKAVPNFGFSSSVYWFVVDLHNQSDHAEFVLEIGYPLLDRVDLYQGLGTEVKHSVGGDTALFGTRHRPHRTLNFKTQIEKEGRATFWIRVSTKSSVQLPLKLYTEAAFGDSAASFNMGFGIYYGLILVTIIFNLFLCFTFRDSIYFSYGGYLVFYLLFQMAVNGTLFEYLLPNHPTLANSSLPVCAFMAIACALRFTSDFLELTSHGPKIRKVMFVAGTSSALCALLTLWLPYQLMIKAVVVYTVFVPPIVIIGGIVAYRAGQGSARFFLTAWCFLLLGVGLYGLKTAGILPSTFVTEYAVQIGSALEVVMLTMAVGDKMHDVMEERDSLGRRMAKQSAALAAETERRAMLEHELRIELESKVILFSDSAHHLNNPLNHIKGAATVAASGQAIIKQTILDLLPEDDDEETGHIREHLETNFSGVEESLDTIDTAVGRAATAVQVLRALSGVDGIPFEPSKLSDTWRIFAERSSLPIDRIEHLSVTESANAMLIGHPAIYAQALEIVMEALWEILPSNEGISVSFQGTEDEASNHSRLIIHYPDFSTAPETSHLDEVKSHIGHLLRPYGSTLEFFPDRTELTLLVKHDKEGDLV